MNTDWYFTAPWNPVSVRRGDALGLRAGSDYFADLIAPGLTNGISDARWISLLSWCLHWSDKTWRNAGGRDIFSRDDRSARYAWLRPLELMWIDRTLEAGQDTGQLRGRRSIERWRSSKRKNIDFSMRSEQLSNYRQIGMYGTYRVIFRSISGFTLNDDGWTPDKAVVTLADIVSEHLPDEARINQAVFDGGTKWSGWRDKEARFWIERGWKGWLALGQGSNPGLLPTPDEDIGKQLPKAERAILEPTLFGGESVRRITAEVLANAMDAQSHAELCDALANSADLSKRLGPSSLALLPAFTRLADTAMHAMRTLWEEINHDAEKQALAIEKLARVDTLHATLGPLQAACQAWLRAPGRSSFPHEQVATRLAEAMRNAKGASRQIQALVRHHSTNGGGRRWFCEDEGEVVPLVSDTGVAASDYRFRLRSICLLAAQCGVADMSAALNNVTQANHFDEDGDAP